MVTANFFNAPLPLVCYQNFYKALPADPGGLQGLIFFGPIPVPSRTNGTGSYEHGRVFRAAWLKLSLDNKFDVCHYWHFHHLPQQGKISIAPGEARGMGYTKEKSAARTGG